MGALETFLTASPDQVALGVPFIPRKSSKPQRHGLPGSFTYSCRIRYLKYAFHS